MAWPEGVAPYLRATVTWGKTVFLPNVFTVLTVEQEQPIDGHSEYEPGDTFCELFTKGEGDPRTAGSCPIEVATFGTLIERLVPDGGVVKPGDPLFVFEARPPLTVEWAEQRAGREVQEQKVLDLERVLRGRLSVLARWIWDDWRKLRARDKRRREEREAELARKAREG